MDQLLIDNLVIIFSLIYNVMIDIVFILRAHEKYDLEDKLGLPFDLLLVPFFVLWLMNLVNGDIGRLGTLFFVLIYLIYDFWYRQYTNKKPRHHPEQWPKGLILYLILFYAAGMTLSGYAFIVSKIAGYLVLISFFSTIGAYFYYQHKHKSKDS